MKCNLKGLMKTWKYIEKINNSADEVIQLNTKLK